MDWWETPIPDVVPLLRGNRNVAVDIADPLGNLGTFRMNHLYPPFNDVHVRRAVLMALSQQDYMQAVVGDDPALCLGVSSPVVQPVVKCAAPGLGQRRAERLCATAKVRPIALRTRQPGYRVYV